MRILAALVFILTASAAPAADIIRVRIPNDATTLDWNRAVDAPSAFLASQIMRGLYRVNSEGNVVADLAESFKVRGSFVTIKIRQNQVWSDGVALTARQFADSIERILDPKTASAAASYLSDIESVRAADALTLSFKLKRPIIHLAALLSHPATFPIRRDFLEKAGVGEIKASEIPTLGPFVISERSQDRKTLLSPNSKYAGVEKAVGPISLETVDSDVTAQGLFESGHFDVVMGVSSVSARKEENLKATITDRVSSVVFNSARKPFDDLRVRKAFALAVSRESLTKALAVGQIPAKGWVPSRLSTGGSLVLKSNVSEAKRLLKESGFENGKGFPKTEFLLPLRDDNKLVAEVLQAQWKEALGISVEIRAQEFKTYLSEFKSSNYAISLFTWSAGFPDAINFLEVFTSSGFASNVLKNKEYDAFVNEIAVERSPLKRGKQIAAAQSIAIQTETLTVPLFEDVQLALVSPRISGFELISGRVQLSRLRKK